MSSLLLPVVLESCSSGLRERHRSSVDTVITIPKLFPANHCHRESSATVDDHSEPLSSTDNAYSICVAPTLSTPSHVQLPDRASKVNIARHYDSLQAINTSQISPSSSPLTPMLGTDKTSLNLLSNGEPDPTYMKLERLRWRLASGFFAYFICGWGDGGGFMLPRVLLIHH